MNKKRKLISLDGLVGINPTESFFSVTPLKHNKFRKFMLKILGF